MKSSLRWMEANNEHFGIYKGIIRYSVEEHPQWGPICWRWKHKDNRSFKDKAERFTSLSKGMKWAENLHQNATSRK